MFLINFLELSLRFILYFYTFISSLLYKGIKSLVYTTNFFLVKSISTLLLLVYILLSSFSFFGLIFIGESILILFRGILISLFICISFLQSISSISFIFSILKETLSSGIAWIIILFLSILFFIFSLFIPLGNIFSIIFVLFFIFLLLLLLLISLLKFFYVPISSISYSILILFSASNIIFIFFLFFNLEAAAKFREK